MNSKLPSSSSSKSLLNALDSPARLQELFAGFSAGNSHEQNDGDGGNVDGSAALALSEKRLLLSAQLGLALLEKQAQLVEENGALQAKQKELEASISQLLDRLAQSYKDNAQLIKRAERANANLDASEASNRQLLITLEEDRKTLRRLKAQEGRVTPLSEVQHGTDLEDLRQELEAERKRANAADAKARRALAKLADNEHDIQSLRQQLDDKAHEFKGRHSVSASRNRSRPNSISLSSSPNIHSEDRTDAQIMDSLKNENALLRVDLQELRSLLEASRSQLVQVQDERSDDLLRLHDDDSRSGDLSTELQSASDAALRSPGASSGPSASTALTSQAGYDWMPIPAYQSSSLMGRLPHTSNESNQSTGQSQKSHARRRHNFARQYSGPRRPGTRAMSVDLSNIMHRKLDDLDAEIYGRSPSPALRSGSPILRPFALAASVNSLSSSIGSPGLPTAHEDDREADFAEENPTILEIVPSPVKALHQGESGLTLSSPTKRKEAVADLVPENMVQTLPQGAPSNPDRRHFEPYPGSVLSSEAASDVDSSGQPGNRHLLPQEAFRENRTAALGVLLEHVLRLVSRLKSADILSLEQRLKRQNLPGDVSLLAKSTMRDILQDIDGMRNHFRQVLEQEAAALAADNESATPDLSAESLMARKDFITIVKLFRDVLHELGRLRLIINRVALEPQLATRLRDVEAIQTPADLLAAALPGITDKSGPAALLAPLSRLFYGNEPTSSNKLSPHSQNNASNRIVPKLGASSALAAATVNVEFGGQGGIRRQVSIMPQSGDGGLAGRYNSLGKGSGAINKAPRRELSSIFAGGGKTHSTSGGEPWVVLPRKASGRLGSGAPASRQSVYQQYSKQVDAVVDSVPEEDELRPNLLERTLRPRGLSDSSIHSTFLSHANPAGRLLSPAGLALSATTDAGAPGEATFARGDATVRARLVPPSRSRPSFFRSGTSTDNGSHDANAVVFSAPKEALTYPSKRRSTNELRPSTAGPESTPTEPHSGGRAALDPKEGATDSGADLGRSPSGPAGLFANIGAWAARAGSNISASYVDPSQLSAERRPAVRSASTSAARKHANRDAEV